MLDRHLEPEPQAQSCGGSIPPSAPSTAAATLETAAWACGTTIRPLPLPFVMQIPLPLGQFISSLALAFAFALQLTFAFEIAEEAMRVELLCETFSAAFC